MWPSSTTRLGARRGPTSSPRRRAVAAIPSSGSRCPPSSRATVARTDPSARPASTSRVAEPRRHERRRHRRRQPRPRQRQPAHLLGQHHDLEHPEPGAALRLGDEHAGPPQLGEPAPQVARVPAVVVEHRPHVRGADLPVEERARGGPQRLLLLAEREVHGRGTLADTTVRFARRGLRLHGGGRGVPRRAAGVARREPPRVPRAGRDRSRARRRDAPHDGAPAGVAAAAARGRVGGHQLAAASGAAARPPRCRTSSTPR